LELVNLGWYFNDFWLRPKQGLGFLSYPITLLIRPLRKIALA
jgi:hypothetical protein